MAGLQDQMLNFFDCIEDGYKNLSYADKQESDIWEIQIPTFLVASPQRAFLNSLEANAKWNDEINFNHISQKHI